jgi:ketosteroid isomerase-like protein
MTNTNDTNMINTVNTELADAMRAGSAGRLAAIYTASGQLLPPNHPVVSGNDNVKSYWQGILDSGITNAKLDTVELDFFGDSAVEVGNYVMHQGDEVADKGKYIVFWKKEGEQWKYHRDIWNSSLSQPV